MIFEKAVEFCVLGGGVNESVFLAESLQAF